MFGLNDTCYLNFGSDIQVTTSPTDKGGVCENIIMHCWNTGPHYCYLKNIFNTNTLN